MAKHVHGASTRGSGRGGSLATLLTGMVLGATLTLVLVQLNAASKLAGSRPFRFFGP